MEFSVYISLLKIALFFFTSSLLVLLNHLLLFILTIQNRGNAFVLHLTNDSDITNNTFTGILFFFFGIPVEEKISLLIGAATQRFTDNVTVAEWRRTSVEAQRWTEASLEYTLCSIIKSLLRHISHEKTSWTKYHVHLNCILLY